MADFDELNKIKVKETMTTEGEEGIMLGAEKTNTYRFLDDEETDLTYGKKYGVIRLSEEFHDINRDEENETLDEEKSKELAKKNSKFSAKDRRKAIAKCKSIRKKKMEEITFEEMMHRLTLKDKEKLEYEKKFIELDAEAREEYIKAYMTDDDKYEIDLSMNRMRKYYRLYKKRLM